MSRHQFDLNLCFRQPGTSLGFVCDKCEGKCPICDSLVNQCDKVRVCDDCAIGKKCLICQNRNPAHKAYYCRECVMLEKNRDGCPAVINVGTTRSDWIYGRKR